MKYLKSAWLPLVIAGPLFLDVDCNVRPAKWTGSTLFSVEIAGK